MSRCGRPVRRAVSRPVCADEKNPALSVDRKFRGASTVGPHTAQPAPAVAPHDPPRQADACRSAIGRPILEHVNEESAWFATNPSINAVCCGHTIRLVQCGDGLCAAWKGDGRFITIVGAETLETLSDVIAVIEETDQPSG